jgi:capsular exopolysaccharide synthesis family protein
MRFLRRRRSIISLIVLLCVGAGTSYLFIAVPKFAAEAVLLIDPNIVEHDQQPSAPMDAQTDSLLRLQSQIEVLKSEKVALAVIKNLGLTRDAEFVGSGFSEKVALAVIKNLGLTRDAEFVGSGFNSFDLTDEWITDRPKSEFELTRRAVKRFEDQLSVTRRNRSYAVQIRFQSVDPKRAALIANAIVDAYIANQMDARYEATRRAAKWLQDRTKELRAQLSAATQSSGADTPPQSDSSIGSTDSRFSTRFYTEELRSRNTQELRARNNDRVVELNDQLSQLQVASQAIQQQSFPIWDARVITEAAPPLKPSSPKSILVLALSGLSGAILGIGAGLLLDGLDRTFRTRGQVSHELEADCIAVIPALADLTQLRPKEKRRSAPSGKRMIAPEQSPIWAIHTLSSPDLREGFCSISAAIESVSHGGKRNQVIGITSAQSKEGKSTIAAGISETMASIGARVILVDCDLRNPWLSSTLTPAPERGLFDVISDVASIEDVAWTDPITGLVFVPAVEQARPEKTNTLPSNSLRQLLGDLRKAYDYVIVDLPTMIQLADIRAVTGEVDSFILVIEWGKTNINIVKRAVSVSRVALLGIVLNKADINALGRYDSC